MAFMTSYTGVPVQDRLGTLQAVGKQAGLGNLGMGELAGAGASNEQLSQIYNAAQGLGLSAGDLARATGYTPEQISNFASQQGLNPLAAQTQGLPQQSVQPAANARSGVFDTVPISGQGQAPQAQPQQQFGWGAQPIMQMPQYNLMNQFRVPLMNNIYGLLSGGYGGLPNYGGYGMGGFGGFGSGYGMGGGYNSRRAQMYQPYQQPTMTPQFGWGASPTSGLL